MHKNGDLNGDPLRAQSMEIFDCDKEKVKFAADQVCTGGLRTRFEQGSSGAQNGENLDDAESFDKDIGYDFTDVGQRVKNNGAYDK